MRIVTDEANFPPPTFVLCVFLYPIQTRVPRNKLICARDQFFKEPRRRVGPAGQPPRRYFSLFPLGAGGDKRKTIYLFCGRLGKDTVHHVWWNIVHAMDDSAKAFSQGKTSARKRGWGTAEINRLDRKFVASAIAYEKGSKWILSIASWCYIICSRKRSALIKLFSIQHKNSIVIISHSPFLPLPSPPLSSSLSMNSFTKLQHACRF
jgi:hypothetical protein